MRVQIIGHNPTAAATRSIISRDATLVLGGAVPDVTVEVLEADIAVPEIDGVDGECEARILAHLAALSPAGAVTVRLGAGHVISDTRLRVTVPKGNPTESWAAQHAIYRAVLDMARPTGRSRGDVAASLAAARRSPAVVAAVARDEVHATMPWFRGEPSSRWVRRALAPLVRRLKALRLPSITWLFLLALTATTSAQQPVIVAGRDSTTGAAVPNLADLANKGLRVVCVSGCTGGGGLTNAELRAVPVPVSGTITATPTGTQNVDPVANTIGLATGAKQDTGNTSLASIDGKITAVNTGAVVVASGSITATQGTATNLKTQAEAYQGGVAVGAAAPLQVSVANTGANATAIVVDGSAVTQPVSLTSTTITGTVAATQSGTWDEVGINDSGNSLTVDAPVGTPVFVRLSDGAAAITTLPVSLASVPSHAVTNAGTFATQVDGAALTALQLIDDAVSGAGFNITQLNGASVPIGAGTEAGAVRVTLPTNGTGVINTVNTVTTITNTVTVAGGAANGSPAAGNPNLLAGRASNAIPTDVGADGDAASLWTNRSGAPVQTMAPHVGLNSDPWNLQAKTVQYTTAQTSAVVQAGGASEKVVVTRVQIQAYGTTAGTAILYFDTAAYTRGTDRAIFDGEFVPSATLKPGVILQGPFISGTNGDDVLFTSVGDLSVTITIWFYLVV